MEGKTAIVTGGTRGIGKGIARRFAEQGANLAFTGTRITSEMEEFAAELAQFGGQVKAYGFDVGDTPASEAFIEDVVKAFGRVDVLVNNAGITQDNLLMRMSEDQWDEVLRVNLKSVFNLTKAVQRTMLKQRSGSIINMSSVVGLGGNAGQANYAASKAGIIGFSKSIAQELGSRAIRCNVIAPGFIETEMTGKLDPKVKEEWVKNIPLKRGGTTQEVADVALFLASDLSRYVTGQVISVCGGLSMK